MPPLFHNYFNRLGIPDGHYLRSRLALSVDLPPPDALFMIGLFHDIGKIFLLAQDAEVYALLLGNLSGEELREAERERFGQDHAGMGGDLLDAWGLPNRMVNVVRYHHHGDLRSELQPALDLIRCVDGLLVEVEAGGVPTTDALPRALIDDLRTHLERARPGAEEFYEAIA